MKRIGFSIVMFISVMLLNRAAIGGWDNLLKSAGDKLKDTLTNVEQKSTADPIKEPQERQRKEKDAQEETQITNEEYEQAKLKTSDIEKESSRINDTIQPFRNISWEDNLIDVIDKISKWDVENFNISFGGMGGWTLDFSSEKGSGRDVLNESVKRLYDAAIEEITINKTDIKKDIFLPENEYIDLRNGKSYYVLDWDEIQLLSSPILIKGVKYTLSAEFEMLGAYELAFPDKIFNIDRYFINRIYINTGLGEPLKKARIPYIFPYALMRVELFPINDLESNDKTESEIIKLVYDKYEKFIKRNTIYDSYNYKSRTRRALDFYNNKTGLSVKKSLDSPDSGLYFTYFNDFTRERADKIYKDYLITLEKDKNKNMKDMGSEL